MPAITGKRVERAALDQAFEHAFVQGVAIHPFAQVFKRAKRTVGVAFAQDCFNRSGANILDCRKTEQDATFELPVRRIAELADGKIECAVVDVGSEHRNAALTALVDCFGNVVGHTIGAL